MQGTLSHTALWLQAEMLATLLTIWCLSVGHALPIVDPGLFVIMGVNSCREGSGYCLLGLDCTLDEDFLPDDKGGHCNGLRSAFTPSANFICCRYNSDIDSSPSPLTDFTTTAILEEAPLKSKADMPSVTEINLELVVGEESVANVEQDMEEKCGTTQTLGNNCWLVKFMNGTNTTCLGSFLSDTIILTSANCISRVFDVGLDAVMLQMLAVPTVIPRNVIRDVIVHEDYNIKLTLNDIGMIRLESAFKLKPPACSLCLPNSATDLIDKPCHNKKMLELVGSPVVCQGSTLGGVVSFYNPEPVYTPITDYLPWIRHNMDKS